MVGRRDLERWPERLPTVTAIRHVGGPAAAGVGSRYAVRQPGLPATTYEILAWDPGARFTWASRSVGLVSTADHRIVAEPDGARLELSFDWSGPLAALIRPLLARKGRAYVETEARTFAAAAAEL